MIFGVTVTIMNLDTDDEVTYRIVGDDEANIKKLDLGKLAYCPRTDR